MEDEYEGRDFANSSPNGISRHRRASSHDSSTFLADRKDILTTIDDDHSGGFSGDANPMMKHQNNIHTERDLSILSWGYEIFSLVVAMASLLGLVGLLRSVEDQEIPQWSIAGWGVTLNAIISIVSTLFRTTLLVSVARNIGQFGWIWYTHPRSLDDLAYYDAASRGVLGSLALIFRLRLM